MMTPTIAAAGMPGNSHFPDPGLSDSSHLAAKNIANNPPQKRIGAKHPFSSRSFCGLPFDDSVTIVET